MHKSHDFIRYIEGGFEGSMKRLLSILLAVLMLLSFFSAGAEEYKLIRKGSKGESVVRLQTRLMELGFYNKKIVDNYGPGTVEAVKRFQRVLLNQGYRISVDGVAGRVTQGYLYDDEVCKNLLNIKYGDTGARVRKLQNRLYDLNFSKEYGDGKFSRQTEKQLMNLQNVLLSKGFKPIQVNGIADEDTRKALYEADLSEFGIIAPEFFDENDISKLNRDYIYSRNAIVMDVDGNILFEKDANTRAYPASLTKMMTLLLSLESGKADEIIHFNEKIMKTPNGSSLVPFSLDEYVSKRDVQFGLMLKSGNEAANALAVNHSRTFTKFVSAMNEKAKKLHMKHSLFTNAHGFHNEKHYSTAKDMALLALELIKNEEAKSIFSSKSHELSKTNIHKPRSIKNSAEIMQESSNFFYENCKGIKTGYTSKAGNCFACLAEKDGKQLIVVVLGARTRNMSWIDTKRLCEFGFYKLENAK